MTVPVNTVSFFVQLRIVEPEHGGGNCNCWGVSNVSIVLPDIRSSAIPVDLTE